MSAPATQSRTLAVVGAGTMGSGIAQKMATEGFTVVLADVSDEAAARGIASVEKTLREGVTRGIFTDERAAAIQARIRPTSRLEDLADAELVVEAIYENLQAKRDLFTRLGTICGPQTVLATNTSSFLVRELADVTAEPGRVVGLHYFYHPAKNRLVEVVAAGSTDPGAFRRAWQLQEAIGKIPIATADSYGFLVNRFFAPWLIEAIRIVDEGVASIPTVEQVAKAAFGIGMGPFELMNVTGLPIALHTANTLARGFGPMYGPTPSLAARIEDRTAWPLDGRPDPSPPAAVAERLAGLVFLVCGSLVDEGVGSTDDVDLGARVGLRWRQGPFEMMNVFGVERAAALARATADRWGLDVPGLLEAHAGSNQPFTATLVRTAVAEGIATLTIERPDKLNALNEAVVAQLSAAVQDAIDDPAVGGIVIAGRGRAFVAGADIEFFITNLEAGRIDRIIEFTTRGHELLAAIAASPKPVVARVHGQALGGGVELALACHAIVAAPEASFVFPETGIGIYPGLGGTQRTPRRVGLPLARWLVLSGQRIDARTALSIGLIDRVASQEALDAAVRSELSTGATRTRARPEPPAELSGIREVFDQRRLAELLTAGTADSTDPRVAKALRALGSKAPVAVRLADELLSQGAELPLEEGLRLELNRLPEAFSTADALEGLTSVGRRAPVFKGR